MKAKVEELQAKVKELTLDNATLKAEVEMYRKEAALPSFSKIALGQAASNDETMTSGDPSSNNAGDEFVSSGNNVFPTDPVVSLPDVNAGSNPLCCALNSSDNILASGGADGNVVLVTWGSALSPAADAATQTLNKAAKVQCGAPVICLSFCNTDGIVCVGCMDGSVHFIEFSFLSGKINASLMNFVGEERIKYSKYVKSIAWSENQSIVASSSADGTAILSKITIVDEEDETMGGDDADADVDMSLNTSYVSTKQVRVEKLKSFHFKGVVETLCFVKESTSLCMYERDTSYLTYFDMNDEYKMSKCSLNGKTTGGFDDFVSFAVMQLSVSPNGKYICAATDSSRNIILEVGTANIIRDLYGHKNDSYSQPRVAWSSSGQYVFGNSQEDCDICVWDVASSSIVKKLPSHTGQIRDMFSSKTSDTLMTVSYDKSCKVWLNAM